MAVINRSLVKDGGEFDATSVQIDEQTQKLNLTTVKKGGTSSLDKKTAIAEVSLDGRKIPVVNGKYNAEIIKETSEDGKVTQTLRITDWNYSSEPVLDFDPVLDNNTWEQIAQASEVIKQNNYTSAQVKEIFGWDLQTDTKVDVGKDGVSRTMHILGFCHDDLSDGSGKAGISFSTVNCEPALYKMNDSATNAGGFPSTTMNTSTLPTIFSLLSDELQSVIKKVDKKSANGGGTNYSAILTSSEDIFLFAEIEIGGTYSFAEGGENEGAVYEYWNGKPSSDIVKYYDKDADGTAETITSWWLRSSGKNKTDRFTCVRVATSGGFSTYSATTSRGVAFGFCI